MVPLVPPEVWEGEEEVALGVSLSLVVRTRGPLMQQAQVGHRLPSLPPLLWADLLVNSRQCASMHALRSQRPFLLKHVHEPLLPARAHLALSLRRPLSCALGCCSGSCVSRKRMVLLRQARCPQQHYTRACVAQGSRPQKMPSLSCALLSACVTRGWHRPPSLAQGGGYCMLHPRPRGMRARSTQPSSWSHSHHTSVRMNPPPRSCSVVLMQRRVRGQGGHQCHLCHLQEGEGGGLRMGATWL